MMSKTYKTVLIIITLALSWGAITLTHYAIGWLVATHRYENVHLTVYYSDIDNVNTRTNYVDIYKDRIEATKWVLNSKGDGKWITVIFHKSEYDSVKILN